MQQAIPYRSYSWEINEVGRSPLKATLPLRWNESRNDVVSWVSESAAVVVATKGCCMSHVVKMLLLGVGANPGVYEVDEEDEPRIIQELEALNGAAQNGKIELPAVFIGGRLFGGLDRVMSTHISGDLIPILKQAGALWL